MGQGGCLGIVPGGAGVLSCELLGVAGVLSRVLLGVVWVLSGAALGLAI